MAQEANAIHDNTTSRTAALFVRANDLDVTLTGLITNTEATGQKSQEDNLVAQAKSDEVAAINTALPVTENVVNDAQGKVQQALQIEQSVSVIVFFVFIVNCSFSKFKFKMSAKVYLG